MDLDRLHGKELVELHHQLFRLHLVQCLGELKEQRKFIEETEKRLVRQSKGQCPQWEVVDNWDRKKSRKGLLGVTAEEHEIDQRAAPVEDWIVSTLPPSFALSTRAEPLAVVLNYTGKRITQNRRFRLVQESCQELYGLKNSFTCTAESEGTIQGESQVPSFSSI